VGAGHIHKGNERASPCNYLPTWQSHLVFASDCDPSFSPRLPGFVLHPGLKGRWGEGAVFPPPWLPPLIDGPASSGTNSWAVFWGAVRAPGVCGCWGVVPCGASSFPPSCRGLARPCVFLLSGDLPNMSSLVHKLSYSHSARHAGAAARCVDYSFT
jgi:hypothetical protein